MTPIPQGVSVSISGGLGNQLFQLAAASSLGRILSSEVVLVPLENHKRNTYRPLEIDGIASSLGIRVSDLPLPSAARIWREPFWGYNPDFWGLINPVHLEGTFQSWNYVSPVINQVREAVSKDPGYLRGAISFGKEPFIAVHLRRGDYYKRLQRKHHGLIPVEWHLENVRSLRDELGIDNVVVFSDSAMEARLLVSRLGRNAIIGRRFTSALELLGAMAQGAGFSFSNSSLSCWTAFLSDRSGAIGVFPRRWFMRREIDPTKLVPPAWRLRSNPLTDNLFALAL